MAWHPIDPAVPGEVIAASWFNEQVGDNLSWLRTQGLALPGQTALDFVYAAGVDTFARMPIASGHVPRKNVAGTAWDSLRAVGLHEMYIPASAFRPRVSGNTPMGWHQVYTNPATGEFVGLPCPYTVPIQDAAVVLALPKAWNEATTIGVSVYWSHTYATGTVVPGWFTNWRVLAGAAGHGEWILNGFQQALVGAQQGIDVPSVIHISPTAPITVAGAGPQKLTEFVVRRQYNSSGDNFGDTIFVGLKLFLTTDALTDD